MAKKDEKTVSLIANMARLLKKHAPQDASHEGLEVCDILVQARCWLNEKD
jgi:hypothetical protein